MLPEPEPVEGVFLTKPEDGYAINYQHHLVNSTSMSYIVRDALPQRTQRSRFSTITPL